MTTTVLIEGMSCGHCLNAVNRALAGVAGIRIVSVSIGRAVLEHQEPATLDQAVAAVTAAGYRATATPTS
jgi:copper chaperone CopZ